MEERTYYTWTQSGGQLQYTVGVFGACQPSGLWRVVIKDERSQRVRTSLKRISSRRGPAPWIARSHEPSWARKVFIVWLVSGGFKVVKESPGWSWVKRRVPQTRLLSSCSQEIFGVDLPITQSVPVDNHLRWKRTALKLAIGGEELSGTRRSQVVPWKSESVSGHGGVEGGVVASYYFVSGAMGNEKALPCSGGQGGLWLTFYAVD